MLIDFQNPDTLSNDFAIAWLQKIAVLPCEIAIFNKMPCYRRDCRSKRAHTEENVTIVQSELILNLPQTHLIL